MNELKTRFLKGWISSENITNPGWLKTWTQGAQEAAEENTELVVFRIPRASNGMSSHHVVSKIEGLLQEEFPDIDKQIERYKEKLAKK